MSYGIWDSLELKLSNIDFKLLTNGTFPLPPTDGYSSSSLGPAFYVLYTLEGLANCKVYWRKMSPALKLQVDSCIYLPLTNTIPNLDVSGLFISLSQIGVRFRDFSFDTKKHLRDSIPYLLTKGYSSKTIPFSSFIYAISNLDYKFRIQDSKINLSLQKEVVKQASRTPLGLHWKLIAGVGKLGLKWDELNVNTRYSLETPLYLYGEVPSWKYTPAEICSTMLALSLMGVKSEMLQVTTLNALDTAMRKVLMRLHPEEISSLISSLGSIEYSYADMSSELQNLLIKIIQITTARMSCWDLVESILGLARLKIPTSFFSQCSFTYYLAAKSSLLGPTPTANLILGVGLLQSEGVDVDLGVIKIVKLLSVKWNQKMPAKEFFKTCTGLALLSTSKVDLTTTPSETIESILRPFRCLAELTELELDPLTVKNVTKSWALKLPDQLEKVHSTMDSDGIARYLTLLADYGITWRTVRRYPELLQSIDELLSTSLASLTPYISYEKLANFLTACVKMNIQWTHLSSGAQSSLLHASSKVLSRFQLSSIRSRRSKRSMMTILWALRALQSPSQLSPLSAGERVFNSLLEACTSDVDFLKCLFAIGEREGHDSNAVVAFNISGSELSSAMDLQLSRFLNDGTVYAIVAALSRLHCSYNAASPTLRRLLFQQITLMNSQHKFYAETIRHLASMGFISQLMPATGDALVEHCSDAADEMDEKALLDILTVAPCIPVENSGARIIYLSKRLFQNALQKCRNTSIFFSILDAFANVYHTLGIQLNEESDEDIELIATLIEYIARLEGSLTIDQLKIFLKAILLLGISWRSIGDPRTILSCIQTSWPTLFPQERALIRTQLENVGAKDIDFPETVDIMYRTTSTSSDLTHDWQTLDELRTVIETTPPSSTYMLPELLMRCVKMRYTFSDLTAAGIWQSIEQLISDSRGDLKLFRPVAVKLPLLLKALDKVGVKESQVSSSFKASVHHLLLSSLPQLPARSVSNSMFYGVKQGYLLTSPVIRDFRVALFRTILQMNAEEFANALWASTHLSLTFVNLSDEEKALLLQAFEEQSSSINGRDMSTLLGALRSMASNRRNLPSAFQIFLLDRLSELIETMDTTSIALSVYSIGSLGMTWDELSVVTRMVIQKVLLKADNFSEKEIFWILVGSGKLGFTFSSSSSSSLRLKIEASVLQMIFASIQSRTIKVDFLLEILLQWASMGSSWENFTPSSTQYHLASLLANRLQTLSASQSLSLLKILSLLKLPASALRPALLPLFFANLNHVEFLFKKLNVFSILQILDSLGIKEADVFMASSFYKNVIDTTLSILRKTNVKDTVEVFRHLSSMQFQKNKFSHQQLAHMDAIFTEIILNQPSLYYTLKLLPLLPKMGFTWDDLSYEVQVKLSTTALRLHSQSNDGRLLGQLNSLGALIDLTSSTRLDMHKRPAESSRTVMVANLKLIDTLEARLPALGDEDFLRVIYLLGS